MLPDMEDWISLLSLDSQTSSQIISEDCLKRIVEDLKEARPLSKDNFETLVNALLEKLAIFETKDIPPDFFKVIRCLCDHLSKREDALPSDIQNFFFNFIEVLLKISPNSLVPVFECILDAIHAKIADANFNVYIKYAILSSLNEISVISSARKVELFLKSNVFLIYTSLASNLRALGDYDTQTQLLEFLLHVIPSARRRPFAEQYIHPDLAGPFCDIIGQNFGVAARKFLNLLNPMDPANQSVFSLPCIGVRLCGYELQCQSAIASPLEDKFWVDFNLVPERITTYYVFTGRATQSSYSSEDHNQGNWETISIYSELIEEVNVSSIIVDDETGTSTERIHLRISTSESANDYARFWESDVSPCYIPEENRAIFEFCLVPIDVVNTLPEKAPIIQYTKESGAKIQSRQQQVIDLLTGLRAYAEKMLNSTTANSPQSSYIVSRKPSHQRSPINFKPKATFANCNSPLSVPVGKDTNSQSSTSLPSTPKPKSFFADPDISFEESVEGFGVRNPTPKKPLTRSKPLQKRQTACTPLSLHISSEGSGTDRRRPGTFKGINVSSSRSVSPPFSVASGLETPTPIGSSKTLEGPKLWKTNYTSPDEDIASVSLSKVSPAECGDEESDNCDNQLMIDLTPQSQNSVSQSLIDRQKNSNVVNLALVEEKAIDLNTVGNFQPAAETRLPQASDPKHKRAPNESESAVRSLPTITEIQQKQNFRNHDETSPPNGRTAKSSLPVNKGKKHSRKESPLAVDPTPIIDSFPHKGDVYDLDEISENEASESKRPNLQTFEKFVEESKLELTTRRHRRLPVGNSLEGGLVEEITTALGPETLRPLKRTRGRPKKLAKVSEVEEQDKEQNNDSEILAGSSDIMRSTSPPPVEVNPSQEDLLAGISPILTTDEASPKCAFKEKQERVLNQGLSVQSTRTLLESAQSFHPGPEKVDAAQVLIEPASCQTPKRAIVAPLEILQERLCVTPERARSANKSVEESRAPFPIPVIPTPIIEEESPSKIETSPQESKKAEKEDSPVPDSGEKVEHSTKTPKGVKRPIAGSIPHIPTVDLDDTEVTPIGSAKTNVLIDEDADVFASPSLPPSRRRYRSHVRKRQSGISTTTTATLDTTFVSLSEDSRATNGTNPSPMTMSPFSRLEAAVNALETSGDNAKVNMTGTQVDLKASRRLWDTTASYLIDQSPCPNSEGSLSQEGKPPPPGGLIVPALGNKYFNITSKTAFARKAAEPKKEVTNSTEPPKKGAFKNETNPKRPRRFFTSTFAERNKREVEKHFYEVAGEQMEPSTPRAGGKRQSTRRDSGGNGGKEGRKRQRKSKQQQTYPGNRREDDFERSSLDQVEEQNDSGYTLQSRPAIRRAARIARQRIIEMDINHSSPTPSSIPVSTAIKELPQITSTEPDTPPSIEKPRGYLNRSDSSLFAPTPNNSAIFDFTLSEDDELVSGLPRLGKGDAKTGKKPTMRNAILAGLEKGRQPIISAGFLADMNQCINICFSTLELAESQFKNRISQLRCQVEQMQRLLRWSQQRHSEDQES